MSLHPPLPFIINIMLVNCWCVVKMKLVNCCIGSDDAKAPDFPVEVLGSRADAPPGAVGIYSKQKLHSHVTELSTINEQTSSVSLY